ncbi:MAG: hypothetical protein ABIH23_11225, partial [bacterium]
MSTFLDRVKERLNDGSRRHLTERFPGNEMQRALVGMEILAECVEELAGKMDELMERIGSNDVP